MLLIISIYIIKGPPWEIHDFQRAIILVLIIRLGVVMLDQ